MKILCSFQCLPINYNNVFTLWENIFAFFDAFFGLYSISGEKKLKKEQISEIINKMEVKLNALSRATETNDTRECCEIRMRNRSNARNMSFYT